jgi:homoserine O-acetyltransferase/O-succinyltransferase
MPNRALLAVLIVLTGGGVCLFAQAPAPDPNRRFLEVSDFRFESGAVLPAARIAYATFGTLNAARDNAVLLATSYGADYHVYDFVVGAGKAFDPTRHFVVITEMFGNGVSSSPSNTAVPHAGPDFPAITIRDNVEASRRVLAHLGVSHVRAVAGFSMGAEQAFQWAVSHPGFMDAIVPWCGTAKTYPHGVVRLESAIRALTADPAFAAGRYTSPPTRGLAAWSAHWAAWVWSQEWWRRELYKSQGATVDAVIDARIARDATRDANNLIAQARAWQRHDVGATPLVGGDLPKALGSIAVPVLYMPCETDLYFPVGDAKYESQFLKQVTFTPIPSLWGHSAGGGGNPDDARFINDRITAFLTRP